MLAQEQEVKNQVVQQNIEEKKQQLEQQIQQWRLSKQLLVQFQEQSQQILKSLQYTAEEGPLSLLTYQVIIKKKEENLLDLKVEIYKDYLDYLILTKAVFEMPFRAFDAP